MIAYLLWILCLRLHISPQTHSTNHYQKNSVHQSRYFQTGRVSNAARTYKCLYDLHNHFRPHSQASNIPTSYVGGPGITYRRTSINLTVVYLGFLHPSRKNPVQYFKWWKALHYSSLLIAITRCLIANKTQQPPPLRRVYELSVFKWWQIALKLPGIHTVLICSSGNVCVVLILTFQSPVVTTRNTCLNIK